VVATAQGSSPARTRLGQAKVKALVLAGGRGTRLRPLTHTRAKQLVPIANKANIDYVIEDIVRAGITDIGVIINPETGSEVQKHLGDGSRFRASLTFILQPYPGGVAHAVQVAQEYLGEDSFVVYLGDNLLDGGIVHMLETFKAESADACILLTKVANPASFGVAIFNDVGQLKRLVEKPEMFISDLALVGVYLFTSRIFQVIETLEPSARGELEITEAIQTLIEQGCNVHAEEVRGYWKDTGNAADLLEANRLVLSKLKRDVQCVTINSELVGEIQIASNAKIENSSIHGPVSIASGAVIQNAFIGPFTSVGEGALVIEAGIENSIMMPHSRLENAEHRLEKSILGEEAAVIGQAKNEALQVFLGDRSTIRL
jgi:glucose-1-phosphate thymidylyltransferase